MKIMRSLFGLRGGGQALLWDVELHWRGEREVGRIELLYGFVAQRMRRLKSLDSSLNYGRGRVQAEFPV